MRKCLLFVQATVLRDIGPVLCRVHCVPLESTELTNQIAELLHVKTTFNGLEPNVERPAK